MKRSELYLILLNFLFLSLITASSNAQNVGIGTASPLSKLDITGSMATAIQTISSATTLDGTQSTILATPSSAYTITLPTAASSTRRIYTIVYSGTAGGNTITIKGNGSENIVNGGTSANTLALTGGSVELQSNGTAWYAKIAATTSGTVTAVTASLPLSSSGGTAPNISLGIVPIANGGTNSSTALSGSSIMVSNGTGIVQGSAGTTTTLLHGNASGAPSYGAVALGTDVSGTLPVSNGGTGATTLTGMLKGNGTSAISALTGTQWGAAYWSDANTVSSTAAGTSGQVLQSNGAAAPTWAAPAVLIGMRVYTSGSGTYTPTAGTKGILVKLVGGGGAGGGANYSCSGYYFAGGGGGAGGYCEGVINSVAASYAYSVGAGGAVSASCGAAAGQGGTTTFGTSLFTANGGTGGTTLASAAYGGGGAGGSASGGTLNLTGASGGPGNANWGYGGEGGGSFLGSGGAASYEYSYTRRTGVSAVAPGSGGGGAVNYDDSSSVNGGAGASGIIIIYEYK